jgi:hypothetical protein
MSNSADHKDLQAAGWTKAVYTSRREGFIKRAYWTDPTGQHKVPLTTGAALRVQDKREAAAKTAQAERASFVHATFETRHFNFEAYGTTREQCIELLHAAWQRHCNRHAEADKKFFKEYLCDVNFVDVRIGAVYMDGEQIEVGK